VHCVPVSWSAPGCARRCTPIPTEKTLPSPTIGNRGPWPPQVPLLRSPAMSNQSNLDVRILISLPSNHLTDLSGQKAIEFAQRAINEDVKQNYAESYKQYMSSLGYFMLAQKCMCVVNAMRPRPWCSLPLLLTPCSFVLSHRRKEREIQGVDPSQGWRVSDARRHAQETYPITGREAIARCRLRQRFCECSR